MIIVTGATGALNGATVDHLVERVPVDDVVVAVRDPARAQRFAGRGIGVRRADYAEQNSLPDAFDGADQLLLVSSSDPKADAVSLHGAAIDAAVAAGVGRILYTSHQGAAADTPFGPGRDHAATEKLLSESGTAWTSLRNGFYAHSLNWLLGPWRDTGRITVPADGPVSWTAREDAATCRPMGRLRFLWLMVTRSLRSGLWSAAQLSTGSASLQGSSLRAAPVPVASVCLRRSGALSTSWYGRPRASAHGSPPRRDRR